MPNIFTYLGLLENTPWAYTQIFFIATILFLISYFSYSLIVNFLVEIAIKKNILVRASELPLKHNQINTEWARSFRSIIIFGLYAAFNIYGFNQGFLKMNWQFNKIILAQEMLILFLWNE